MSEPVQANDLSTMYHWEWVWDWEWM